MHLTHIRSIDAFQSRALLPAGERSLPVWIINGARPGPTLVLTAGVHGCEYVGILALRRLADMIRSADTAYPPADMIRSADMARPAGTARSIDMIRPEALAGRLILLPLVNAEGFYAGAKGIVPSDGKNINRVFPARPGGTEAEQIALAIQTEIYPEADFLLDLHGGDVNEAMTPLVFFPKAAAREVNERSRLAASHLPVDVRIPSTAKNGLYSHAARCGIPALLMEVGGLGRWTEEEVEQDLSGIRSLMGFLGMGETPRPNPAQREAAETLYLEAEADGLWFPRIRPGQAVSAEELLGVLEDLEGNPLQTVRAAWDGIVWYHTVSSGVRKGDALVAYGRY